MRRIGRIGGMSFKGLAVYYRKINEAVRGRVYCQLKGAQQQ